MGYYQFYFEGAFAARLEEEGRKEHQEHGARFKLTVAFYDWLGWGWLRGE